MKKFKNDFVRKNDILFLLYFENINFYLFLN